MRGQRAVFTYLENLRRHDAPRFIGHNPAGGWMILGLLTLLVVISATGVMQLTRQFFGEEWVELTHEWSANALLVLIPIHVAGVAVSSLLHRENLIKAMIVGWKPARTGDPISASGFRDFIITRLHGLEGLVLLMVCTATAFFYGWQTTSGVVRDLQTAPEAGIAAPPPATQQSRPAAQLTPEMYGPLLSEETRRRLKKKRRWRSRK